MGGHLIVSRLVHAQPFNDPNVWPRTHQEPMSYPLQGQPMRIYTLHENRILSRHHSESFQLTGENCHASCSIVMTR